MSTQDNITKDSSKNQASVHAGTPDALGANVGRNFSTGTQLSKVGENILVDLHDNIQRGITESTTGVATFQVKSSLGSFQLTSDDEQGTIIFIANIDTTLSSMSEALASQYVNYRITHLSLTVRNVSPFATASGSIQIAYINDPDNVPVLKTQALETLLRQTNSRQVGAKDTLDMDFNQTQLNVLGAPSGWKFCKPRGIPILDRYGNMAVAVRGTPAIGDGAQFVVSVAATFEFFGMTENLETNYIYSGLSDTGLNEDQSYANCRYPEEYGVDELEVNVHIEEPTDLPISEEYTCVFAEPRHFKVHIVDDNNRKLDFPAEIKTCTVKVASDQHLIYRFVARSQRMANLNRPFKDVIVTHLDEHCSALVIVPSLESQLIHDAPIDERTRNELRMFESLNRAIDARLAKLNLHVTA